MKGGLFGDEYEKKELLSIFFQKNYVTLHIDK